MYFNMRQVLLKHLLRLSEAFRAIHVNARCCSSLLLELHLPRGSCFTLLSNAFHTNTLQLNRETFYIHFFLITQVSNYK